MEIDSQQDSEIPAWLTKLETRIISNPKAFSLPALYKKSKPSDHNLRVWQRIVNAKIFEQKTPDWIKEREKAITAADVDEAIGDPLAKNSKRDYVLKKVKGNWEFPDFAKLAMEHGNTHEDLNCQITCKELNELGFGFGLLFHEKYPFLAMSPDIIFWFLCTLAELKAPYGRNMLWAVRDERLVELAREILYKGKIYEYHLITNLTEQQLGLTESLKKYWHQMQFQMEILNFETDYCFYNQLGIGPNKYYVDMPIETMSVVKRDFMWLPTHIDSLTRTWDEIQKMRQIEKPWSEPPKQKPTFFPLNPRFWAV